MDIQGLRHFLATKVCGMKYDNEWYWQSDNVTGCGFSRWLPDKDCGLFNAFVADKVSSDGRNAEWYRLELEWRKNNGLFKRIFGPSLLDQCVIVARMYGWKG